MQKIISATFVAAVVALHVSQWPQDEDDLYSLDGRPLFTKLNTLSLRRILDTNLERLIFAQSRPRSDNSDGEQLYWNRADYRILSIDNYTC